MNRLGKGYEACALGAAIIGAGLIKLHPRLEEDYEQRDLDEIEWRDLVVKEWPFLKNEKAKASVLVGTENHLDFYDETLADAIIFSER